jgi:arylsulfatase A-like enzyme
VLTGKWTHANGFYNNTNSRFDGSQTTFPKLLQKAGYQTAMIGKWHLVTDPTGFDHWEILPGQGQYYNPPMIRDGQRVIHPGYVTDVITDLSLDWLKKRDPNRPFLLMCHHKAPHREWEPALEKLSLYDGKKFPEPPTLFDDYSGRGKAEHEQEMEIAKVMNERDLKLVPPATLTPQQREKWDAYYNPRNEAFRKANPQGKELVRWKYQRYMHDYLACISSVDDSVGKVLDYLKETGLDHNTIVVYASDQGFYLGEHGWFDKRWIFEESVRTPCVVRWPGVTKPGSVSKEIVSNADFAETFLDAAGVPVPAEMQGRSMRPVLAGKTPKDWRKSFYFHYYEHPAVHNVARHYGVVTERYKLVHFYEPEFNYWELFDRQKDPRELTSVYGRPEYAAVQKELETELARLRKELKVPDPDPAEADIRPARAAGGAGRPLNAWVLEYRLGQAMGERIADSSGHQNAATVHGVPFDDGSGRKAAHFDGKGYIDVGKSRSLNPAVGAWAVEATFKAEQPSGVVLACGGESNGYCLSLENGRPAFHVATDGAHAAVTAPRSVVGEWITVTARVTAGGELRLSVNGAPVASATGKTPGREPNEGLQIGTDLGSQVVPGERLPPFRGWIESVRLYSGEAP